MKYRNKKVVLICGYSRGGTNLIWNILQSHTDVTTPIFETGTIFRKTNTLKFSRIISLLKKVGLLHSYIGKKIIDYQLYRYKMNTLSHPENQYKGPDQKYSKSEVSKSVLCLKSVDHDIDLTDLILNVYPDTTMIFLSRNVYAVAEGQMRRGADLDSFIEIYLKIFRKMKYYLDKNPNTIHIKFEDALKDPFAMSEKLYRFCNFEKTEIDRLRLKSKKAFNKSGNHSTSFGELESKYWFDREKIQEIIVEDVNQNQIKRLDKETIDRLTESCEEAIRFFGYDIIRN